MIVITMPNMGAGQALEVVNDLRRLGYVQGQDFDFKYFPTAYQPDSVILTPKKTEFTCYQDSIASYVTMKWT